MKKSRTAKTNLSLFLIALPGIIYLLINNYAPMLGIFLAFKNYSLMKGPFGSDWCGFDNFEFLFKTKDAWIMTRNTLLYNTAFVKNLHGQKNVYYQVNATYYSALGEDDKKMLVARAIQLFMPGKPQVWYLDLFAGQNDHEAVARAGEGGHKEINRTNLTVEDVQNALAKDVVQKQIELLRFRKASKAFTKDAKISVYADGEKMVFIWEGQTKAELEVDFVTMSYVVREKGKIEITG